MHIFTGHVQCHIFLNLNFKYTGGAYNFLYHVYFQCNFFQQFCGSLCQQSGTTGKDICYTMLILKCTHSVQEVDISQNYYQYAIQLF